MKYHLKLSYILKAIKSEHTIHFNDNDVFSTLDYSEKKHQFIAYCTEVIEII